MPHYWHSWAKKDAEAAHSAASASSSRASRAEWPALAARLSSMTVSSTTIATSMETPLTTPPSALSLTRKSSAKDAANAFHGFVDLAAELQIKIIGFAWASIERKAVNPKVNPCDFELGRMGLFCPSVPSFNDFRRSFEGPKLSSLADKAIFLNSSLLVHVQFARESYYNCTFLPLGYIPTVLLELDREPILREHIRELFLDISCLQGQMSRPQALKQSFESRFREDNRGGRNYYNALRRQNELATLVSETTKTFPNRQHLHLKLKVDYMSHMDLVTIFGFFHAPDKKITLEEFCTIQGGGEDKWPTVQSVKTLYGEISAEAAVQAGHDWLLRDRPTYSIPWEPFAEAVTYGQIMYKRTTVWEKRR